MQSTPPSKPAATPAEWDKPGSHVDDNLLVSSANARSGLLLFFVYLALYAGFMALAALAPQVMSRPVLAGVNLAIVYGMGLIGGALVVAAVYMWMCGRNVRQHDGPLALRADLSSRGAKRPQSEADR
jgi:uncharacterized membrane protein (DUF485 family)